MDGRVGPVDAKGVQAKTVTGSHLPGGRQTSTLTTSRWSTWAPESSIRRALAGSDGRDAPTSTSTNEEAWSSSAACDLHQTHPPLPAVDSEHSAPSARELAVAPAISPSSPRATTTRGGGRLCGAQSNAAEARGPAAATNPTPPPGPPPGTPSATRAPVRLCSTARGSRHNRTAAA
eukprot:953985-Prorocentrum_minimum.AAC.2